METLPFNTTPEKEIVTTRIFDFPQKLVYQAWANPVHLKNWWGPKGFTNTFNEFDFKEGGKWNFVMHGPDKGNYANECEFVKIDEPSFIAWERHSKPLFQVVAMFKEVGAEQTEVVFKMVFATEDECNKLRPYVVDKNEENFDKLDVELSKM